MVHPFGIWAAALHPIRLCPGGERLVQTSRNAKLGRTMLRSSRWTSGWAVGDDACRSIGRPIVQQCGPLFIPDGDTHFAALGEKIVDYQRADREAAYSYVHDCSCVVDMGAHVGIFSRDFAERFTRVWAFEPARKTRECLSLNVPSNVVILPFVCSNMIGMRSLNYASTQSSGSTLVEDDPAVPIPVPLRPNRSEMVPAIPLDSLDIRTLGLLKMDIQGSEYVALQGSRETLLRCRPVILIEEKPLGNVGTEQSNIQKCADFITALGATPRERMNADRVYTFD